MRLDKSVDTLRELYYLIDRASSNSSKDRINFDITLTCSQRWDIKEFIEDYLGKQLTYK